MPRDNVVHAHDITTNRSITRLRRVLRAESVQLLKYSRVDSPGAGELNPAFSWQDPGMIHPVLKPVLRRHGIHLATGDTVNYDSPTIVVVEGGALKIYEAGRRDRRSGTPPAAWASTDVQPLNR
jgi:hypothetical protein